MADLLRCSNKAKLVLVALANLATVADLYWAQALLAPMSAEFGPSRSSTLIPSATLFGYAIGVALLSACARDLDSRHALVWHIGLLAFSLFGVAAASDATMLIACCALTGIGCSITQRWLTIAGGLVAAESRARAIGSVIAAGLCGIVLTRACGPSVVDVVGWRGAFVACACFILLAGGMAARAIPPAGYAHRQGIRERMPSVLILWRQHPVLRTAAGQQATIFAAYNMSWALVLAHPGLAIPQWALMAAACCGACAAFGAGRICVLFGATRGAAIGASLLFASGALQISGFAHLSWMMVGMAGIDAGTQIGLVSNQTRAQALGTSARLRGRFAAMLTTVGFLGGALGAAAGNVLAQRHQVDLGWAIVTCLGGFACFTWVLALGHTSMVSTMRRAKRSKPFSNRVTGDSM